jgi:hypothetical protein
MKKALIIVGIILMVIIGALAIIPVIFKDDIRKEIDKQLESSVNAEVFFEDFGVTMFRNFPGLTVYMTDFGVTGRDEFEGLPLVAMESFELEINLFSVLFGDQIKINGISLASPQVYVKVLEDGKANYDIAISGEDSTTTEGEEESGAFSVAIDHWQVTNGKLIYDDEYYKVYMRLIGLEHNGSGNFNEEQFDLAISTAVDSASFSYEDAEYLSNQSVEVSGTINISENYSRYTFGENTMKVNDFAFGLDGLIALLEDGYDLDLTYQTQDNSFKSLLSILPAEYMKDIEAIETNGNIAFGGFVKGTYSETSMPGFEVQMKVNDAMFKYPDLPSAIQDINFDMSLAHENGETDMLKTSLDLRSLSMDMGGNPISANLKVEDFIQYPMDGKVTARLDLAEINSMVPVEGLQMKGIFSVNASARGKYDSIAGIFPTMDISMGLKNGFIKSVDFPIPIEQLNVEATVKNTTGKMKDLLINVADINMVMDQEKLNASAVVKNMEDYEWDVKVHGGLNLDNIMKIYPIEGMELSGKINADIDTKGKMSDLDAGRYEKLPTSGNVRVAGLAYKSPDLPQGMTIQSAEMVLTPKQLNLRSLNGTLGKSDMSVKGILTNYMGYALKDNEVLRGQLSFSSNNFDVNEWMVETEEEESVETVSEEEGEMVVTAIPKDLDFSMNSSIGTLLYDNLTLKDLKGVILIRGGVLYMKGIKFNTLGGQFAMDGNYDTRDIEHPKYNFDMGIQKLSFAQSYAAFNTVQAFAPIAQLIDGNFSTDFKVNGELNQDMSPNLSTLDLNGLFEIAQATLIKSDILDGISSVTNLEPGKANKVTLRDVIMKTSIEDGRIKVDPFKLKLGDYTAELGGSYGLDKKMDYLMTVDVPAGQLGSKLNSSLASLTGKENTSGDIVKLPINIGGTYTKPTFKVGSAQATKKVVDETKTALEDKAKEEAKEEVEDLKEKAKDKLKKLFKGN